MGFAGALHSNPNITPANPQQYNPKRLQHAAKDTGLEALRDTPKLPAVHGQHNDVAVWFPDQANLINMLRFQECSYHLLLAASVVNAASALNLYTLAYDELFGITPILCSCILGLGSDLLQRMEDFQSARRSHLFLQLPPAAHGHVSSRCRRQLFSMG
jgi:hypothetical protein